MKKGTIILWLILILLPGLNTFAQRIDFKDSLRQQFQNSKNLYTNDFYRFYNRNDSIFLLFLNQTWTEFTVFKADRKPRPKPIIPPIAPKTLETFELPKPSLIIPIPIFDTIDSHPGDQPPEYNDLNKVSTDLNYFDFLGQKVGISKVESQPIYIPNTKSRIIKFFENYTQNERLNKITKELFILSKTKQLNDWGFFYLLRVASASVFKNLNDQVLFTWLSLQSCGYDVKVAYNKEDIYLLAAFKEKLYSTLYINVSGKKYIILLFPAQTPVANGLLTYEQDYPGKPQRLSTFLTNLPKFANNPEYKKLLIDKDSITILLNINLIDFFKDYPDCELAVYFNAPISKNAMECFDRKLSPIFSKKSEKEKVSILLKMMHEGFPYKIDEDQFGRENYLFPDESLFYPFTDCEDRAALFAQMISHYTTLTPIGLEYSDHVSVAVKFTEPTAGDFILVNNKKFLICDPTYIGAEIGMAMNSMKNSAPSVIPVFKNDQ